MIVRRNQQIRNRPESVLRKSRQIRLGPRILAYSGTHLRPLFRTFNYVRFLLSTRSASFPFLSIITVSFPGSFFSVTSMTFTVRESLLVN